jgi:DivIVA domain-containing protein
VEDEAAVPSEPAEPAVPRTELRPARGRTFLPELTGVEFSSSRRGYDRDEVDRYVERVSRIVVELEAMRSPDAVIERALADVGEETSAIIRRAREAAEEIIADAEAEARRQLEAAEAQGREVREHADRYSAQVRAEAEKALSDARARAQEVGTEAAADARRTREEADEYHERVGDHVEQLAQERHRLIEDVRALADNFHRAADRALEALPLPRQPHETDEPPASDSTPSRSA